MHPKVNEYFGRLSSWEEELKLLREIILDCLLIEEFKWRNPCYTFQNNNILIIGGFKEHCFISFLKGVLLQDEDQLLVQPGENSQSVRMFKFKSLQEIKSHASIIKTYIAEALEIEKAGLKVEMKKSTNLVFPQELQDAFLKDSDFKNAFFALTPGRQRAYNIHFSGAKQTKTVVERIEKCTPKIFKGFGFNDCDCGLSKRKPNCDGSHR